MVFGVAMHKDYAIPGELGTQVRISVDRDRNGATDIVLRNYASSATTANVYLTGTSATNGNVRMASPSRAPDSSPTSRPACQTTC